jgi:hypothetical protein
MVCVEPTLFTNPDCHSMRPKVVAAVLLLAVGALGVAALISRVFHPARGGEAPGNLSVARTETNLPTEKEFSTSAPLPVANDGVTFAAPPVIQETNSVDHVHDRVAELMALAMNDDADSLESIWSELSNSDKQIREGALEAVVQFGDRSVVPRLRELATQTEDPVEKVNILAAADHLELPTFTEFRREQQTNGL